MSCRGFDVMPYGHLSWIIPSVTFFAMLFFLFPAFRCSLTVEKQPGDIEIWYGYWQKEDAGFAVALGKNARPFMLNIDDDDDVYDRLTHPLVLVR